MIDVNDVRCPKCQGPVWDERPNKKNPRGPDFRCKDKTCLDEKGYKTSIWERDLVKGGAPAARTVDFTKLNQQKQPHTAGPYIPAMDDGSDALPTEKLDHLFRVYIVIEDHVLRTSVPKFTKADVGTTPESVAAQIATLLIAAQKVGV